MIDENVGSMPSASSALNADLVISKPPEDKRSNAKSDDSDPHTHFLNSLGELRGSSIEKSHLTNPDGATYLHSARLLEDLGI